MVYADLDLLHNMRGLTQQHLPVLEFLNSVGLFERKCWETLDHLLEGINSGATRLSSPLTLQEAAHAGTSRASLIGTLPLFMVSPCQHGGKATTGKGRSAATRKAQSIMPINEASIGCPATRGAVAARCSPDMDISSSESGQEALSPDTEAAAKTLAEMTARDAHLKPMRMATTTAVMIQMVLTSRSDKRVLRP
ncbi:TPA: hypothetical protein ACH3X1_008427 [Trebouxia sp. C0004]